MRAPPLAELYELLRAEGFAIGVGDHVRIGRLLEHDATWTVELLRTAVRALVVIDPGDSAAFDACWERWIGGVVPPMSVTGAAIAAKSATAAPAAPGSARSTESSERVGSPAERAEEISPVASSQTPGTAQMSPSKPSAAGDVDRSRSRAEQPRAAHPQRRIGIRAIGEVMAIVVAVVVLVVQAGHGRGGSPSDPILAGPGSFGQPSPAAPAGPQVAGAGSALEVAPGEGTGIGSDAGTSLAEAKVSLDVLAWPTVVLGAIVLMIVAMSSLLVARARQRFLPGPWRYLLAVPPAVRPVLSRTAIEDAAADLTWRAPGAGREFDVARSVAATVERGGHPTLFHRRQTAAPRYLVLEDTAGGAERWHAIYDELLEGLAREGVAIDRYRFVASPERCLRSDGETVSLGELVDHTDALIVIGDGEAAVDPLDGHRAGWLALLHHIPRRLWINPVPPVRWSAGAHAIAEDTPMEHGVAGAVAALHAGIDRRARPEGLYPAVLDRAPDTASAVAAMRAALGEPTFHLVSAVAVAAPPTMAAARWVAEALAIELDEQDWLAVTALPWFRAEAWPQGLRDRLRAALETDAPGLALTAASAAANRHAVSEPPRDSVAHLAWQLEGAELASSRGERAAAERTLRRIAVTPLAGEARHVRVRLGIPDHLRRARNWALASGTLLLIAGTTYLGAVSLGYALRGGGSGATTGASIVRVAVLAPDVSGTEGRTDVARLVAAVRNTIETSVRVRAGLDLVPRGDLESYVDGVTRSTGHPPAQRATRAAVGADEVLAIHLACSASSCNVTLERDASGPGHPPPQSFQLAADGDGSPDDTLAVHMSRLYPDHPVRDVDRASAIDPRDHARYVQLVQDYWAGGGTLFSDAVLAEIERIRQRSPRSIDVLLFEAEVLQHRYLQTGDPDPVRRATALLATADHLLPDTYRILSARFDLALSAGQLDVARAVLDRLALLDPDSSTTYLQRAKLHYQRGELKAARDELTAASRRDSFSWHVLYHRALVSRALHDWADTRAAILQLLERFPGNYGGLSLLASEERRAGRLACAEQIYQGLVAREPLYDECLNLGYVRELLGRYREATESFRCALAIRPDEPWARLDRAESLLLAGDADDARAQLRELLALLARKRHDDPGGALSRDDLLVEAQALGYLGRGDPDAAVAARARVDELLAPPVRADVLSTAAQVHAYLGDRDLAARYVTQYLDGGNSPVELGYPWFADLRKDPVLGPRLTVPRDDRPCDTGSAR